MTRDINKKIKNYTYKEKEIINKYIYKKKINKKEIYNIRNRNITLNIYHNLSFDIKQEN